MKQTEISIAGNSLSNLLFNQLPSLAGRLLVVAILLVAGLSAAHADACSALRSQLNASGSRGQVSSLNRQLTTIRNAQRQRRCGMFSTLFNSTCRDLSAQRGSVQRQIQSASRSGGNAKAILARLENMGCSSSKRRSDSRSASRSTSNSQSFGGSAMLFCVRPRDGYFFPAPHSQFTAKQDLKTTQDMCRYICEDPEVDVYTLDDIGRETEEMVSVETNRKYLDLPAAFAYRENADFQGCDLQRYYRRVDEARARTVTPRDMTNARIAIPTPRPDLLPSPEVTSGLTAYSDDIPAKPMSDRPVRQIGTSFFPPQ